MRGASIACLWLMVIKTCSSAQQVLPTSSTIVTTSQLSYKGETLNLKQQLAHRGGDHNPTQSMDLMSGHSRLSVIGGAVGTKLRDAIFPVYGKNEIVKFLLLGSMKFFIIIVLTLTRDTKDTLIVTQCGAEAIAFLKIYGVLPSAVAFTAIYSKASNILSKQALFYSTCIPFFIFFLAYDFLIRPNIYFLEPSVETVKSIIGASASDVIANILSHWTSALFFVVAEIYSSVSIGILFWKTANDFVSPKEAQRFYPLFAYMSGFGPILAGQYVARFASLAPTFDGSIRRLTVAIGVSGVMILLLNHSVTKYVASNESKANNASKVKNGGAVKKSKPKMKVGESVKFLASSQYLRCLATLVVSYGLMYNFTEISWKSLLKKKYPDALDYQRFMGNFSSIVGASTFAVIFCGGNLIKHLGWRIGSAATPFVMATVSIPFFIMLVFMDLNSPAVLGKAVNVGTALILLSRSFKYGMFDATTQMAYIPLDEESKVKGKAAIDVLGSRLGKSGASFIQQGLVLAFGNIISAAPVISILYYSIAANWLSAVYKLGRLYESMTQSNPSTAAVKKGKSS